MYLQNSVKNRKTSKGNVMRKVKDPQTKFGEVHISEIKFNYRSRDEIPKLLKGLQYIYCTPELREEVFKILEGIIPEKIDTGTGRPGMELWKILVLGTIQLNCNWDYDKLQEIANNHRILRQMLGHGGWEDEYCYPLQTLKDNVSLLTPEILDQINQVVVKAGHKLIIGKKKEKDLILTGNCDSFVVETNVHYPTDINLLFDAIRKVITLTLRLCYEVEMEGWRQGWYGIRKIKKLFRKAQQLKRSTSKNKKIKVKREKLIIEAHKAYIDLVKSFLERVKETIKKLRGGKLAKDSKLIEIEKYIKHAERQIDQIERRVIRGESIPANEKVFSVFEEHTEWICKGKAGVLQELGLKVCVLKDQYGFILYHHVMQKQTDEEIAVVMIQEAKERFSNLNGCSFDKGFYSPANSKELKELLERVTLPRLGRPSKEEYTEDFIQSKRKHSAVESAINALENHGLDRCPDHGIIGFKRYVSIAVLARNIQILGNIIHQKELKREKRRKKYRETIAKKKLRFAA